MPDSKRPLRVFLCHSSGDKPAVRELYQKLAAEGWIDPWLDTRKLLPGQDWRMAIEEAVETADNVVICLSTTSVNREGFVQKEMRYAREISLEKAEGTIFLIPIRLDACEVPRGLRFLQWVDYFDEQKVQSYSDLLESLKQRYEQKIRLEAEARARAEEMARKQAEERMRLEAEARERKELEERIQKEAREKVRREMEERLRKEAEERAREEFDAEKKIEKASVDQEIQTTKPTHELSKREEKPQPEQRSDEPVAKTDVPEWLRSMRSQPGQKSDKPVTKAGISEWVRILESPKTSASLVTWGGIEFVRIPAGKFLMGSKEDNQFADFDEKPQHTIEILYDYWMARFPVMNEQYAAYVGEGKHPVGDWKKKKDHPVDYVYWQNAMAYCKWLNGLLKGKLPAGLTLRLPTEAEWEKAARGTDGREWQWGNKFNKNKCNSSEGGKGGTTPVGLYSPAGDSPFGCADMAGNVPEWCSSLYKPYPYKAEDGREDEKASGYRVLRGGFFEGYCKLARCAFRRGTLFDNINGGFRVAVAPPISEIIKRSGR